MRTRSEEQRFCPVCNEWRTVRGTRLPQVKHCRAHMKHRPSAINWRIVDANGYARVRVAGRIEYEHRAVWVAKHGAIPEGFHIHHRNHVRDDNRIENLVMVQGGTHVAHHSNLNHASGVINNFGSASGKWRADLDDELIVRRRNEGATFRQIGRELGAPHNVISHHYRLAITE